MIVPSQNIRRSGFALPMTIIAVAGLTLLLIGLITILSLERKTARSYSDSTRADLAVESGLAAALATLTEIAQRDDSIVFRIEDPANPQITDSARPLGYREQFFTYGAVHENGNWRGLPLFSGSQEIALGGNVPDTQALREHLTTYLQPTDGRPLAIGTPSAYDQSIPRARRVEIPPTDAKDYLIRYAYWIEDLSGRIDGVTAGSEKREAGLSSAEIPLAPLLEGAEDSAGKLTENRLKLRTAASIRTLLSAEEAKQTEPYLIYETLTPEEIRSPRLIPQGFGYTNAGTPAPDLNDFVSVSDVIGIANHISSNLPLFANRRGAMGSADDYLYTLAANIIDYADTDQNPTIIPVSNGRAIRGVDSYPFVNIIVDRYKRVPPETGKPKQIAVEVRTFIELWNPSDQTVTGKIRLHNIDKVGLSIGGPRFFGDRMMEPTPNEVSLAPNEHKVLELFVGGVAPVFRFDNNIATAPPYGFIGSNANKFELFWNDMLVDGTVSSSGMNRAAGGPTLRDFNKEKDAYTSGNVPPLIFPPKTVGDPRITYYLNRSFSAVNYADNTAWGGRNKLFKTGVEVELDPGSPPSSASWADGGHNYELGIRPGSNAWLPGNEAMVYFNGTQKPKPYPRVETYSGYAPTRISNDGQYQSVAELGNVFDPAQVANVRINHGSNPATLVPGDAEGGGGYTLAVGRPEFPAFDREGHRAAQLLDLFTTESDPKSLIGRKININTASAQVLKALVSGQPLTIDANQPTLLPPVSNLDAEQFERQVIGTRSAAPLRGFSDLALINPPAGSQNLSLRPDQTRALPTDPQDKGEVEELPYFGNSRIYKKGGAPGSDWSDAGREEHLSRMLNLVRFNSNLFRIVVEGQAVSSDGKTVLGTKRTEYHYAIFPSRMPDGTIDPSKPATLRKFYEKNL